MAFTKSPEYNTHQITRLYPAQYLGTAFSNIYATVNQPFGIDNGYLIKERERPVVYRMPPWKKTDAAPAVTGSSSGLYSVYFPSCEISSPWVVVDDDLYRITTAGVSSLLANNAFNSTNDLNEKGFAEYNIATTYYTVATDRGTTTDSYIRYFTAFGVLSTSTTLTSIRILKDIVFLDGYLFVASDSNNTDSKARIYNSSVGDPTVWNLGTDFLDAEIEGDVIRGLAKHHNHLVAFGATTIEFFYNAGNELGSPLQRQANYSKNIGLIGNHISIGDTIYFIGVEKNRIGFYKIDSFKVSKIESSLLDTYLNKTSGSVTTSVAAPGFRISPFALEHDVAIAFSFISGFYNTLLYVPTYDTFSSASYLYSSLGLAGDTPFTPVPNGNCVVTTNTTSGNVQIGTTILSYSNELFYPSLNVFFYNEGFTNDNYKHIKWVDVNGKFRSEASDITVSLYGIKGPDVDVSTAINMGDRGVDLIPKDAPLRWRNLGRSRYHTFQVSITGVGPLIVENIEVAYNAGTH